MFACPHCDSTDLFMAFKDGILMRVLEDHEDVDGIEDVGELLCTACNQWFPNPSAGCDPHDREMTGELVTITGLRGDGTIKTVATGVTFPFHYDTYEDEAAVQLAAQSVEFVADLLEFSRGRDATIALRVKEAGNPNTWVYRLDKRRLRRALKSH